MSAEADGRWTEENWTGCRAETMLGTLRGVWDGIDDEFAICARTPPGDNNRCGARAYRQWMAANG